MIRVDQSHLPVSALTHPGMAGKQNEDRYAVSAYQVSGSDDTPALLAVLSDGIGGHRAGEVAAEIAVNQISENLAASDSNRPLAALRSSVQAASQAILSFAESDTHLFGMGATCAVVWIIGQRLFTATVGDSRIYLIRGQNILQLSTDHTWIQEALDSGVLQPEEVPNHPNAHVIRRFLGSPSAPDVDVRMRLTGGESDTQAEANQGLPLMAGDALVLCSDGLTDVVAAGEICSTLRALPFERAARTLIDLACSRNANDNITVIAIQVPENFEPEKFRFTREELASDDTRPLKMDAAQKAQPIRKGKAARRLRKGFLVLLGLLAVALLVIALQIGSWLTGGRRLPTPTPRTPEAGITLPATQLVPGLNATLPPPGFTPGATSATRVVLPTSTPGAAATAQPEPVTLTPWPTNTLKP